MYNLLAQVERPWQGCPWIPVLWFSLGPPRSDVLQLNNATPVFSQVWKSHSEPRQRCRMRLWERGLPESGSVWVEVEGRKFNLVLHVTPSAVHAEIWMPPRAASLSSADSEELLAFHTQKVLNKQSPCHVYLQVLSGCYFALLSNPLHKTYYFLFIVTLSYTVSSSEQGLCS